jgi:hypothetical protein
VAINDIKRYLCSHLQIHRPLRSYINDNTNAMESRYSDIAGPDSACLRVSAAVGFPFHDIDQFIVRF